MAVGAPPADIPPQNARNCVSPPHIGWATHAARARLMTVAIANVKGFLHGQAQNRVA